MRRRTLPAAAAVCVVGAIGDLLDVYYEWDGVTADVEATASARRTEPG